MEIAQHSTTHIHPATETPKNNGLFVFPGEQDEYAEALARFTFVIPVHFIDFIRGRETASLQHITCQQILRDAGDDCESATVEKLQHRNTALTIAAAAYSLRAQRITGVKLPTVADQLVKDAHFAIKTAYTSFINHAVARIGTHQHQHQKENKQDLRGCYNKITVDADLQHDHDLHDQIATAVLFRLAGFAGNKDQAVHNFGQQPTPNLHVFFDAHRLYNRNRAEGFVHKTLSPTRRANQSRRALLSLVSIATFAKSDEGENLDMLQSAGMEEAVGLISAANAPEVTFAGLIDHMIDQNVREAAAIAPLLTMLRAIVPAGTPAVDLLTQIKYLFAGKRRRHGLRKEAARLDAAIQNVDNAGMEILSKLLPTNPNIAAILAEFEKLTEVTADADLLACGLSMLCTLVEQ